VRVPIVGRTGVRCLAAPDCYDGYQRLVPAGSVWQEDVPARILLTILGYRPIRAARRIQAPVLIIAAAHDSLIPLGAIRKIAAGISHCQLEVLPVGHFDLYQGPWFERSIALQLTFIRRHLGLAA
jgi:pimeloyl-ACP methyl ester carboxylesterase